MITFRSSLICLLALSLLASCGNEDDVEVKPDRSALSSAPDDELEFYAMSVTIDGELRSVDELAREFDTNPNAFELAYSEKSVLVAAKLGSVPKYETYGGAIANPSYSIPLIVRDAMLTTVNDYKDPGEPKIDLARAFIVDFSLEEAAKLRRGQSLALDCEGLRIVQQSVVFDGCKLKKSEKNK